MTPRFVVDTMLGRLARWLRAMGYDTLYPGQAEDRRLLQLSRAEERILVTSCLIHAESVDDQVLEAVERLALSPDGGGWLSRCLECNARLEPGAREALRGLVPEHVFATHADFMRCPSCARIYWAGSHADRMLERLTRLLDRTGKS
ncbi:MAG: hypothetical protein DMD83_25245 [Candidatus Rokuibacteriota bacterium]|nr:MAG: hypothetical protein DMD83_25245 [Candidatus Rokubacteria bacterium]